MSKKKIILLVLTFLLLGGGLAAGVTLVREQQLLPKKASTGSGTVEVKLTPVTKNLGLGESMAVTVSLTTASEKSIKGLSIKLNYSPAGSGAPLTATGVTVDNELVQSGWNFPIKKVDTPGVVSISGLHDAGPYVLPAGTTAVAVISFSAVANGTATASFDPTYSVLQDAGGGGGQDILLTPAATGTYVVGGGIQSTPTPTPTTNPGGDSTPTATPTPRQVAQSPTVRPTARPTIPVAGGIGPTVSILIVGAGLLIGGMLLLAR